MIQSKYMEAILDRFGMKDCNTSPTPAHGEVRKIEKGEKSGHDDHK